MLPPVLSSAVLASVTALLPPRMVPALRNVAGASFVPAIFRSPAPVVIVPWLVTLPLMYPVEYPRVVTVSPCPMLNLLAELPRYPLEPFPLRLMVPVPVSRTSPSPEESSFAFLVTESRPSARMPAVVDSPVTSSTPSSVTVMPFSAVPACDCTVPFSEAPSSTEFASEIVPFAPSSTPAPLMVVPLAEMSLPPVRISPRLSMVQSAMFSEPWNVVMRPLFLTLAQILPLL